MKSLTLKLIMGAAALVLAALPARAARISDSLSVFDSNGGLIGFASSSEPEPADQLTIINDQHLGNQLLRGDYYLVFEPDGTLSDIVGLAHQGSNAFFAYVSDPLTLANWIGTGNAFDGIQLGNFREPGRPPNGGTFNISNLLSLNGLTAGESAQFFSDGEANVPDGGSTVALLGIAVAGVAALRRKFKPA